MRDEGPGDLGDTEASGFRTKHRPILYGVYEQEACLYVRSIVRSEIEVQVTVKDLTSAVPAIADETDSGIQVFFLSRHPYTVARSPHMFLADLYIYARILQLLTTHPAPCSVFHFFQLVAGTDKILQISRLFIRKSSYSPFQIRFSAQSLMLSPPSLVQFGCISARASGDHMVQGFGSGQSEKCTTYASSNTFCAFQAP